MPVGLYASTDGGATFTQMRSSRRTRSTRHPRTAATSSAAGPRRRDRPDDPATSTRRSSTMASSGARDAGRRHRLPPDLRVRRPGTVANSADRGRSSRSPVGWQPAGLRGRHRRRKHRGLLHRRGRTCVFGDPRHRRHERRVEPAVELDRRHARVRVYDYCAGQCWYDMPVFPPPGFPNVVYIGGADAVRRAGRPLERAGDHSLTDTGVNFTDMSVDEEGCQPAPRPARDRRVPFSSTSVHRGRRRDLPGRRQYAVQHVGSLRCARSRRSGT